MKAFHDDKTIKMKYIKRVEAHAKADEIIQGTGWDGFKGCAVGCTLENYDHSRYPIELGIPEWLAKLEDSLFETLPKVDAMKWPAKFLKAINVGADLEQIKIPYVCYVLETNIETLDSLKVDKEFKDVIEAIRLSRQANMGMINALKTGKARSAARLASWSARLAAESARLATESATESAARSAAWSAAWSARLATESARLATESAAESAARSAARSARSATWSARSAAESARSAAELARSATELARSARSARSAVYLKHSIKLLELIRSCK